MDNEFLTTESGKTFTLSNVTSNEYVWVSVELEDGTVYQQSADIYVNGFSFWQSPAFGKDNKKAGEKIYLSVCPVVDGNLMDVDGYEFKWVKINGESDRENVNDPQKDELLCTEYYGDFLYTISENAYIVCYAYKDNLLKGTIPFYITVEDSETGTDTPDKDTPNTDIPGKESTSNNTPNSSKQETTVPAPVPQETNITVNGSVFVLNEGTATVIAAKKAAKVSIPATIKVNGKTYKVTAIAANAFKNNKKVKSVVIGKNVTTIGKNAFYGCKNLKKVIINSKVLKSVGKAAFKKTGKLTVKVPVSKKKAYTKLLKKGNLKGTIQ